MNIHFIIHAPFEKPGVIEDWAINKSFNISYTHTYRNETLPESSQIDFLVIMGGPQSPLELDNYPYLRNEIILTKEIITQKKLVFGVCLGAQIIGESLGAKTERSPNKEVGFLPIHLTSVSQDDFIFKDFPQTFDVMHWHNDMPGLTATSSVLAYSEGCPRQVVKFDERIYGFQCHMEMTTELVKGMIEHCGDDLKTGKYVQTADYMLKSNLNKMNEKMKLFLNNLVLKAHNKN